MKKLILLYLLAITLAFGQFNTFPQTGGNAATATALAANGANCSAGSYPLGVDASGAVESCTVAGSGGGLDLMEFYNEKFVSLNANATAYTYDTNTGGTVKWPVLLFERDDIVQFFIPALPTSIGTTPTVHTRQYFTTGGHTSGNVVYHASYVCWNDADVVSDLALSSVDTGTLAVAGVVRTTFEDSWTATNMPAGCDKGDAMVFQLERETTNDTAGTAVTYMQGVWLTWTN